MSNRIPGLFITGTDTGVGKTYVTALIARSLASSGRRVGVYKPAASGCRREGEELVSEDAVALWNAADRPGELNRVCPQRFVAPLAPHLAAREEGKQLDADLLRCGIEYWRQRAEIILVEGAGGLMSPLGEEEYVADLAEEFGFPLVVVSRNMLGTINQTLQTLIAAAAFCGREKGTVSICRNGPTNLWSVPGATHKRGLSPFSSCGLPVAGVVLNHTAPASTDDVSLATNRRELAARCATPILAEVVWGGDRFDPVVDWFALAQ
jgi:dethiobiotin synthetase